MKKILLILMICGLFANRVENNEVINITKERIAEHESEALDK